MTIEIVDKGHGRAHVRARAAGRRQPPAAGAGGGGAGGGGGGGGGAAAAAAAPRVPTTPASTRVTWDLRYPRRTSFPGMILWGGGVQRADSRAAGHLSRCGSTADGRTQTQPFRVRRNPLYTDVTDADLQAQFDLAIQIRDKTSEANNAVIQIRDHQDAGGRSARRSRRTRS